MNAALLHVPFDGWSDAALASGAADAGVEQHMVSALFPRGAIDAIALHSRLADAEMVAAFHALPETPQKIHLAIGRLFCCVLNWRNRIKTRYGAPDNAGVAGARKIIGRIIV